MYNVGKYTAASTGESPFAEIHSGFRSDDLIPFVTSITSSPSLFFSSLFALPGIDEHL